MEITKDKVTELFCIIPQIRNLWGFVGIYL